MRISGEAFELMLPMLRGLALLSQNLRTCGNANLLQRRVGGWHQDFTADICNNRSIAFALVAHLVPSGVVHECRPRRLEIGQRLRLEYVSQLVAGFPDKSRPKADRVDAVLFPDGRKQVPKPGLQLRHLARKSLIHPKFINHRENSPRKTHLLTPASAGWHRLASCAGACRWPHRSRWRSRERLPMSRSRPYHPAAPCFSRCGSQWRASRSYATSDRYRSWSARHGRSSV